MDIIETLKTLCSCYGPSGCEAEIREKISELAAPHADRIYTDVMGNLIAVKSPAEKIFSNAPAAFPMLMFAAHMDSVGLMVTYIEESGLLRFGAVGLVDIAALKAAPVRFKNGTLGTVGCDADAKEPSADSMFIDIGAKSRKDAEKYVRCGDMAVYDTAVRALGEDRVAGPYLDNRVGVAAQLLAMELLKAPKYECFFVFTVQEEVGHRGAKPAVFGIDPQYAVVCDTTYSDDTPGSNHMGTAVLGGGAAVKVMDKSVICHPEMVSALKAIADKKRIPAQTDIIQEGGTDGSEMRKNASGVWTGGVSIATRYIHSPQEVCSISDIEAAGNLMAAFAEARPAF